MSNAAKLDKLAPAFARRLRALIADAPTPISITSGYRSRQRQQELYDAYVAGTGNPANRPGTSRHETGHAADLGPRDALTWAHAAAPRYGLRFPYSHEPWHVEPVDGPHPLDQEDLEMTPEQLRGIVREEVNRAVTLILRGEQDGKPTGHSEHLRGIRADLASLDVPRKRQ